MNLPFVIGFLLFAFDMAFLVLILKKLVIFQKLGSVQVENNKNSLIFLVIGKITVLIPLLIICLVIFEQGILSFILGLSSSLFLTIGLLYFYRNFSWLKKS